MGLGLGGAVIVADAGGGELMQVTPNLPNLARSTVYIYIHKTKVLDKVNICPNPKLSCIFVEMERKPCIVAKCNSILYSETAYNSHFKSYVLT